MLSRSNHFLHIAFAGVFRQLLGFDVAAVCVTCLMVSVVTLLASDCEGRPLLYTVGVVVMFMIGVVVGVRCCVCRMVTGTTPQPQLTD